MRTGNRIATLIAGLVAAGIMLSGCVYYPPAPRYAYAAPGYYAPGYYAPAYGPGYYGPPVAVGVGGWRGGGRW